MHCMDRPSIQLVTPGSWWLSVIALRWLLLHVLLLRRRLLLCLGRLGKSRGRSVALVACNRFGGGTGHELLLRLSQSRRSLLPIKRARLRLLHLLRRRRSWRLPVKRSRLGLLHLLLRGRSWRLPILLRRRCRSPQRIVGVLCLLGWRVLLSVWVGSNRGGGDRSRRGKRPASVLPLATMGRAMEKSVRAGLGQG